MIERGLKTVARRPSTLPHPGDRPDLVGKVIDQRFRVLSLIGSGGMADVYEVEHVTLGRRLALKLLRHTEQSNAAVTRRFSREARALSRITSEHVVSIFDHGVLPSGFPYFVMELLRGRTLRAALDEEHQLTPARTSNLGIDVCLGLAAAHQRPDHFSNQRRRELRGVVPRSREHPPRSVIVSRFRRQLKYTPEGWLVPDLARRVQSFVLRRST